MVKYVELYESVFVMSFSVNGCLKLSSIEGRLIGSTNIYSPLPTKWNLLYDRANFRLSRVTRSIQLLRQMKKEFANEQTAHWDEPELRRIDGMKKIFIGKEGETNYLF